MVFRFSSRTAKVLRHRLTRNLRAAISMVRVSVGKGLPPGVQHRREADLRPEMLRIAAMTRNASAACRSSRRAAAEDRFSAIATANANWHPITVLLQCHTPVTGQFQAGDQVTGDGGAAAQRSFRRVAIDLR
jgi:hypothetical protein